MTEVKMAYEPKNQFNRRERRFMMFHKPTKYSHIKLDDKGNPIAYLHPTKGLKGNKAAVKEIMKELKESK